MEMLCNVIFIVCILVYRNSQENLDALLSAFHVPFKVHFNILILRKRKIRKLKFIVHTHFSAAQKHVSS